MNTSALTYRQAPAPSPFPVLIVIFAGLVFFAGVILSAHAFERHGEEAVSIRRCLDNNGPVMVYKHKSESAWYLLCHLNDGRFGIQAVTEDGHEKTAFVRKDGSFSETMRYLREFATRFKGALPWK